MVNNIVRWDYPVAVSSHSCCSASATDFYCASENTSECLINIYKLTQKEPIIDRFMQFTSFGSHFVFTVFVDVLIITEVRNS